VFSALTETQIGPSVLTLLPRPKVPIGRIQMNWPLEQKYPLVA